MMNIYLMLTILIANLVSLGIVYNLIKKLPAKEKIIFMAVSVASMYILVSIVYWISGFNIEASVHESSKNFIVYLFVPINVILFIPFIANKYSKFKKEKIKKEQFTKTVTRMLILLIVVIVIEYFYFVNIQKNIMNISDEFKESADSQLEKDNIEENKQEDNVSDENIIDNDITNSIYDDLINETNNTEFVDEDEKVQSANNI